MKDFGALVEQRTPRAPHHKMIRGKKLSEYLTEASSCPDVLRKSTLVHYIWLSDGFDDSPTPSRFAPNLKSISVGMPDRQLVQWTDSDAAALVEDAGKSNFFFYSLQSPVERSDYLRMLLLHRFGGVYVDVDMMFQASVEPYIDKERAINLLPSPLFSETFQSCMLVANCSNHPFWNDVAESIEKSVRESKSEKAMGKPVLTLLSIPFVSRFTRMAIVVFLTGPGNLDRTMAISHAKGLYVNDIGVLDETLYCGPIAVHQQAASWTPFDKLYKLVDMEWAVCILSRWRSLVVLCTVLCSVWSTRSDKNPR